MSVLDTIRGMPPAVKYGVPIAVVGGVYLWRRYRSSNSAATQTPSAPTGSTPTNLPSQSTDLAAALNQLAAQEQADVSYLNKTTATDVTRIDKAAKPPAHRRGSRTRASNARELRPKAPTETPASLMYGARTPRYPANKRTATR